MKTAAYTAFVIFMGWGWVNNLISLAHTDSVTPLAIARVIGIFATPLGTLLGYCF